MTASPDDLDAYTDLYGQSLAEGCRVRSFDFSQVINGQPVGMDLHGDRACYVEGFLDKIDGGVHEGCSRYRISVDTVVVGGQLRPVRGDQKVIYPPHNGTRTMFGARTIGVVAVQPGGRTSE
ncbi:hypothetical protein [Gordonia malaquae]|uniref:hypothetical protein n=1 Tax=Gordonia malaquae TaxID=410332 RepID=UPI00301A1C91